MRLCTYNSNDHIFSQEEFYITKKLKKTFFNVIYNQTYMYMFPICRENKPIQGQKRCVFKVRKGSKPFLVVCGNEILPTFKVDRISQGSKHRNFFPKKASERNSKRRICSLICFLITNNGLSSGLSMQRSNILYITWSWITLKTDNTYKVLFPTLYPPLIIQTYYFNH